MASSHRNILYVSRFAVDSPTPCRNGAWGIKYFDRDKYVYAFPDSSDYTIGIIVDPCKVIKPFKAAVYLFFPKPIIVVSRRHD